MRNMLFITIFMLLATACATTQPEKTLKPLPPTEPPLTLTPLICEDGFLCLTFDGESCTYEGPTDLASGPAVLVFFNDSPELAAVNVLRHTGDETIQDAIDHIGEEPSSKHHPSWSIELGTWKSLAGGMSLRWEGVLEPGIHHMVCASFKQGVWFGTGLTVEE